MVRYWQDYRTLLFVEDALGLLGVGGEGGEEEAGGWVVEDQTALPSEGAPAVQLPKEAAGTIVGMVVHAAVEEVFFYLVN